MTVADHPRLPDAAPRVLIPIGVPLGLQHPAAGAGETVFRIRLGREVYALTDDMLGAWLLAHSTGHGRASLAAALARDGVADPVAAIESLLGAGLLLETGLGAEPALVLAATCRLVPLMAGVRPADGGQYVVGVPGSVERRVGGVFYEVFCRATSTPSMLEALAGWLAVDPDAGLSLDVAAERLLGELAEPLERGVVALERAAEQRP